MRIFKSNQKQNLVVFMDPPAKKSDISIKGGNMIINRFCIDEDAAFELSGVYCFHKFSHNYERNYEGFKLERKEQGMKEHFDKKVIDSAFQKITKNNAQELKIHIIYAGSYYFSLEDILRSLIRKEMKKYKIKFLMVTIIAMERWKLITKEAMEKYCNGVVVVKDSVNDDLESFFEDLRLGTKPNEIVPTYYFPKLTTKEMELVDRQDQSYLKTFDSANPDVPEAEMKLSESDSKFVHGWAAHHGLFEEHSCIHNRKKNLHKLFRILK